MARRKSLSVMRITSKENRRLKAVRALVRSKKERQTHSCFVIEGVRALRAFVGAAALPSYQLKEVWVSDEGNSLVSDVDVPVYSIPAEWMEQLSDCRTSQGVLGVVKYDPLPLEILPERGTYLLLDDVKDPGNLGTLIRSAVAFGFSGVFLRGECVELFNPKVVRATMGALPFISVWRCGDEIFQTLEAQGYDIISTVMKGGGDVGTASFGGKNVLVVGNEARGISLEVQHRSTRLLSIPLSEAVESLNAAVAGSICMFFLQGS